MFRTRQNILDVASEHLLKQNRKSMSMDGHCLYRSPTGQKCAIGALIPDERYCISLENHVSHNPGVMKAANLDPNDENFARGVQRIHDNHQPEEWPGLLDRVANTYGLVTPQCVRDRRDMDAVG